MKKYLNNLLSNTYLFLPRTMKTQIPTLYLFNCLINGHPKTKKKSIPTECPTLRLLNGLSEKACLKCYLLRSITPNIAYLISTLFLYYQGTYLNGKMCDRTQFAILKIVSNVIQTVCLSLIWSLTIFDGF